MQQLTGPACYLIDVFGSLRQSPIPNICNRAFRITSFLHKNTTHTDKDKDKMAAPKTVTVHCPARCHR